MRTSTSNQAAHHRTGLAVRDGNISPKSRPELQDFWLPLCVPSDTAATDLTAPPAWTGGVCSIVTESDFQNFSYRILRCGPKPASKDFRALFIPFAHEGAVALFLGHTHEKTIKTGAKPHRFWDTVSIFWTVFRPQPYLYPTYLETVRKQIGARLSAGMRFWMRSA